MQGQSGLFLPLFGYKEQRTWDEGSNSRYGRAVLYLLGLLWFFLGVSIIADVFMAAIETITSKEKKVPGTDVSYKARRPRPRPRRPRRPRARARDAPRPPRRSTFRAPRSGTPRSRT